MKRARVNVGAFLVARSRELDLTRLWADSSSKYPYMLDSVPGNFSQRLLRADI